jgi:hypothetical protein
VHAHESRPPASWQAGDVGQKAMPILKCHQLTFNSQLDEEMFFYGLGKISAVKKIEGVGQDVLVSVPAKISDKALRELLGLFFRYEVDLRQLAPFLTEKNRSWFCGPEAYWYKKVFPKK